MKRIWLWIAFLTLTPSIVHARFRVPLRHRVRFSPYAFSYRSSGLVPGGIKYSPYAFRSGNTGLVLESTRYSPYAYSYAGEGLIVDYYQWHVPPCVPILCCANTSTYQSSAHPTTRRPRQTIHAAWRSARSSGAGPAGSNMARRRENGLYVIRQYLRDRGCRNVGINHLLRIDGIVVSVNFTLRDKSLIIKYWNSTVLDSLEAGDDCRAKAVARHQEEWERLARTHKQTGGDVYTVCATEQAAIVAALDACERLGPSETEVQPSTMYAKR